MGGPEIPHVVVGWKISANKARKFVKKHDLTRKLKKDPDNDPDNDTINYLALDPSKYPEYLRYFYKLGYMINIVGGYCSYGFDDDGGDDENWDLYVSFNTLKYTNVHKHRYEPIEKYDVLSDVKDGNTCISVADIMKIMNNKDLVDAGIKLYKEIMGEEEVVPEIGVYGTYEVYE